MTKDIKNKARGGTPNAETGGTSNRDTTGEPTWRDPASLPRERVTEEEETQPEQEEPPAQQAQQA